MVNVDKAFELRYKTKGEQFEVLVDFDMLMKYKKNNSDISVYDVLADTKIFKDQMKGEIASTTLLEQVFPNKSEEEILSLFLLEGECQIPTSFLNKLRDEKKNQVVNYIVENAINPVSKSKYTSSLISSTIDKLKYNFDPHKDHIFQAEEIIKQLKKEMPISMNKVIMQVCIPGQYVGAFYGNFRKFGRITKEYYSEDGSLHLHIEISENQIDTVGTYVKNHSNSEGEYHISK